jgi:hypothetical protein
MTNKNKTSSDASTSRSHQKRKVTYTPPSYLDAPKPNVDGVKYRWLRVSTGGEDDARNIAKRKREGYEFVKKEEHPDFDVPVDNDLLKEQNPSMPITQRRNSSVSYGKKKGAE